MNCGFLKQFFYLERHHNMKKLKTRIPVSTKSLEEAIQEVIFNLEKRIEEKGNLSTLSAHEALGIITEEYIEFVDAVRSNDPDQILAELVDIVVPAIFYIASHNEHTKV